MAGLGVITICVTLIAALAAFPQPAVGHRQRRSLLESAPLRDVPLRGACKADIVSHCSHMLTEQQRETVLDQEAASKPKPEAGAKESSVKRDVAQQLQQLQQLQTTLGGKAEAKPVAQAAASLLKADAVDAAGASTTLADKGAAAATTATTNAFDVAEEEEDKEDDKDAAGEEEEEEEQEEYGAGGGQGSATSAAGGGARRLMAHADEEDAEALKTLLPLYNLSPSLTLAAMAAANAPLAHCLKKAIHEGDLSISPDAPQVSDECQEELREFFVQRNADLRNDLPLLASCAADLNTWCSRGLGSDKGLACLKERKELLKPRCRSAVTQRQIEASEDVALVPELNAACGADREAYCKAAGWGEGAALACLVGLQKQAGPKGQKLSDGCALALVQYQMEQAEDIRFNFKLAASCALDKQVFCRELRPDDGQVLDCLEAHRQEAAFTLACREAVEENLHYKVADSRLDYKFRRECGSDVEALCADEEANSLYNHAGPLGTGALALECARRNIPRIRKEACRQHVYHLVTMTFADNRLDSIFLKACTQSAQKYCSSQMPNSILCLKSHMRSQDDISEECAAMTDERLREAASDLNFSPKLAGSCAFERQRFCSSATLASNNKALDCLIDHRHDADFSSECKQALVAHLELAVSDIRLLHSLHADCKADIKRLCNGTAPGEGRVINCLGEKRLEISGTDCKRQMLRLLGFVVEDARLDYHGMAVCKADIQQFCAGSPPAQVHKCLRASEAHLHKKCRAYQRRLESAEHQDVRLSPRIQSECTVAVATFCKDVKPGNANVLTCLQHHMLEEHFPFECREVLDELMDRSATRYHLNAKLVDACEQDVFNICSPYSEGIFEDDSHILTCLAANVTALRAECKRELSAAVRMQFKRYRIGSPLTAACDGDVTQWCNVDQLALPFIESGYIQTCLVKSFARLHPPCWALISTFDEAHMQHAKEAEAAADTGNLDAHISKVAAEVRRDLEPRMIHNIASKLNTDIIMPYRRMAPQLNRLLYASLFMMVLFGAMMIVLGILATKYQQARRAPGGTTVIKDGRV